MTISVKKKNSHKNIIGHRIRLFRKFHNLTGSKFGNIIGISQGTLSNIETGHTKPSADTIASIVRHTNINPDWLLLGEGLMCRDRQIPQRQIESQEKVSGGEGTFESAGSNDFFRIIGPLPEEIIIVNRDEMFVIYQQLFSIRLLRHIQRGDRSLIEFMSKNLDIFRDISKALNTRLGNVIMMERRKGDQPIDFPDRRQSKK